MAVCFASLFSSRSSDLRYQPTPKRLRVRVAGVPVADTTRAVLVWEPHRVVPQYAVPIEDVYAQLVPEPPGDKGTSGGVEQRGADGPMVLTPSGASPCIPATAMCSPFAPWSTNTLELLSSPTILIWRVMSSAFRDLSAGTVLPTARRCTHRSPAP
jgi:hypothetical protein